MEKVIKMCLYFDKILMRVEFCGVSAINEIEQSHFCLGEALNEAQGNK